MKNKLLYTLAVLLSACSASEQEAPYTGDGKIRLSSGIAVTTTRGVVTGTDPSLEGIRFLRMDGTKTPADFSPASPFIGKRLTGGTIEWEDPQYYADNGTDHAYFVAYHPAGTSVPGGVEWPIDGRTDVLVSGVTDAGRRRAPGDSPLTFSHRLSLVKIVFRDDAEATAVIRWGRIKRISLADTPVSLRFPFNGVVPEASVITTELPLSNASCDGDFVAMEIPAADNETVSAAAMVVPTAASTLTLRVTTQVAGMPELITPVQVNLGKDYRLLAGKTHTLTLTFQAVASQVPIAVSSIVQDWEDGQGGAGEIN